MSAESWYPKTPWDWITTPLPKHVLEYWTLSHTDVPFLAQMIPHPGYKVTHLSEKTPYWLLDLHPHTMGWVARCLPVRDTDKQMEPTDALVHYEWHTLDLVPNPATGKPQLAPAMPLLTARQAHPSPKWVVKPDAWKGNAKVWDEALARKVFQHQRNAAIAASNAAQAPSAHPVLPGGAMGGGKSPFSGYEDIVPAHPPSKGKPLGYGFKTMLVQVGMKGQTLSPESVQAAAQGIPKHVLDYFAYMSKEHGWSAERVPLPGMRVTGSDPATVKLFKGRVGFLIWVRPMKTHWQALCFPASHNSFTLDWKEPLYVGWAKLRIVPVSGTDAPLFLPPDIYAEALKDYSWPTWMVDPTSWLDYVSNQHGLPVTIDAQKVKALVASQSAPGTLVLDETTQFTPEDSQKLKALFASNLSSGVGFLKQHQVDVSGDTFAPEAVAGLTQQAGEYNDHLAQVVKAMQDGSKHQTSLGAAHAQDALNAAIKAAKETLSDVMIGPQDAPKKPQVITVGCCVRVVDANLEIAGEFGTVETVDPANYGGTLVLTALVRLQSGKRIRLEGSQLALAPYAGVPEKADLPLHWQRREHATFPTVNEDGTLNDGQEFEYDVFVVAGEQNFKNPVEIVPVTVQLLESMIREIRAARNNGFC